MKITDITDTEKRFIQYFIDHSKENNEPISDFDKECKEIINHLSINTDEFNEMIKKFKNYEFFSQVIGIGEYCLIRMNYSVYLKCDYLYQQYHIDEIVPKVICGLKREQVLNAVKGDDIP